MQSKRLITAILFLGIILGVFGILRLDVDNLSFGSNQRSYIYFSLAFICFIIFTLLNQREKKL